MVQRISQDDGSTPTTTAPPTARSTITTLWDMATSGGFAMIPLAALSVLTVMLVLVYLFTLRRGSIVSAHYMNTADVLLKKRDYLGLLAISSRHSEAIARVVQRTLDFASRNPGADLQVIREIAETEGSTQAASLQHRIVYLADIGMIAPLLGLLGTVLGIIRSFGALGADLGSARYVLLSKGISEALVNTCAGLAIGIPAMVFYAFFRGKAQKLISELESASTHVLALLSLQYDKRTERSPVLIEDEL